MSNLALVALLSVLCWATVVGLFLLGSEIVRWIL